MGEIKLSTVTTGPYQRIHPKWPPIPCIVQLFRPGPMGQTKPPPLAIITVILLQLALCSPL